MKHTGNFILSLLATATLSLVAQGAIAQQAASSMQGAAQAAVANNPEVLSRFHAIKAAQAERDAARGGFLPRVDLTAAVGPQRRSDISGTERASSGTLSLTQLIWDGMATRNEVSRLDHAARVRLYEFFDTSNNVALEAARAYLDVRRYRELVKLAEDNFVEHRAVFGQTEKRVNARIARAVDLEQVTGRLALAEANLLTETANLHDTGARFQRLVGNVPPRDMPLPPRLSQDMPANAIAAVEAAQRNHPALRASIENVRAAEAALATRNAAYQPRLDFRLRRDHGTQFGSTIAGVNSSTVNASAAEVVLSWNLFNGMADRNREKQFAEQLNITKDVRDKTCRDIRQTVVIAQNDIQKLTAQLQHLQLHEASVGRAMVAYRQQFDIGQRSLLDLLDTENELFQARRAVVNAQADLLLAYVRTQAGTGNLLRALELTSMDTGLNDTVAGWSAQDDAAQQCPAEPITVATVDRQELLQRVAERTQRTAPQATSQIAPGAAPSVVSPALPAPASPSPAPLAARESSVRAALEAWRKAWATRDAAGYIAAYAPQYAPADGAARADWEKRRRAVIGKASGVSVDLSDLTVTVQADDRATTRFVQQYRSPTYNDRVVKALDWVRVGGQWKIAREASTPLLKQAAAPAEKR